MSLLLEKAIALSRSCNDQLPRIFPRLSNEVEVQPPTERALQMRHSDNNTTVIADRRRPGTEQPQRRCKLPRGSFTFCTLFALASFVLLPQRASAGNITYTWVEDDTQIVTGSLVVLGTAQQAGNITSTDVVSFAFSVPAPDSTYDTSNFVSFAPFPIPISVTDASPTTPGGTFELPNMPVNDFHITISFDTNWSTHSGEAWTNSPDAPEFGNPISGVGHWTITGAAAVPEPSSFVLAGLGIFVSLAYASCRRYQTWRRSAANGMTVVL